MQQKKEWIKKQGWNLLIWGLISFFALLYISLLFNRNIWTDEAFTLELLQGNYKEIIQGTANDVHPPFYYFYSKIFYDLTNGSLWVQKFISIIPQVATYALIATVFRKKFGSKATFLTILFFTCIPCTMEFTVQVRMYSLALFFVTLCALFAYEAYTENTRRSWIFLTIGALGAAYTHYFAFVSIIIIVGVLFLLLLFYKRYLLGKWGIAAAAMIIGYLPWVKPFIIQVTKVRENYWIPPITPEVIWGYFKWTFDLELFPGVVYGVLGILAAAFVIMLVNLIRNKDQEDRVALLSMLIPTITVIMGVIISLSKSPIYRDQYVFPALMLLAVFFGLSFRKLDARLVVVLSAFFLFIGAVQYKECFRQEYRSTYVDKTLTFFEENYDENDIILYNMEVFGFIYRLYFPEAEMYYIEDFDFSQDYDTIWFLDTHNQLQITQSDVSDNNLVIEFMGLYGIEHNEFDIYKVYRAEGEA